MNDVPYILVERISYSDAAPWPAAADGFGLSLHRIVASSYGNDPTNWAAAAPTPGSGYVPGTAPVITGQPGDRIGTNRILFGTSVSLPVTATGTGPLRYQWNFQGVNLLNETNASLNLASFQPANNGVYGFVVYNSGGYATGTNFLPIGRVGLAITTQPTNRLTFPTSGVTSQYSRAHALAPKLLAPTPPPIQWRFSIW